MAQVTVLTAVYNAASYLRQCLDSLRAQTLADCQFVCIDDCSTDGSWDILLEYARMDPRFEVLRTPVNSGQAHARNLGLLRARGDYVAMLDSDDWFSPDTLELAVCAARGAHAQCAVLQLVTHDEESGLADTFRIASRKTEWSGEEAFRLSLDWSLHGLYIVERGLHLRFPFDESCRLYSDDNTTRLHYLHSHKVVLSGGCYHYRKHAASMTRACTVRRFDHLLANLSMARQLDSLSLVDKETAVRLHETHRWRTLVGCYGYFRAHRRQFTAAERAEIHGVFAHVLPTIRPHLIPWRVRCRFGYWPLRPYVVFRWVENFFFALRRLAGRG